MTIEGQNPYRGPFSYKEADENIFFGRDSEVEELIELIRLNQLTILYGASGTGKTSLIHAKLLPQLKREYFHPIYIRINFANKDEDPLLFVQKRIVEELRTWDEHIPDFQPEQSLIQYAAKNVIFKGLIKPVLFFDQFEELFSLGPKNDAYKIHRFIFQLSELIELRLPDDLKTLHYINNISSFKVVFSLRQDWIGFLDDFSQIIPSINEVRYRLKKFSPAKALEAIKYPSKNNITHETATAIIKNIGTPALWKEDTLSPNHLGKDLINIEVDPFVLSLYCYQLYDKCIEQGHVGITTEFVLEHQDTELIRNYYEEKIAKYTDVRYLIEDKLLNESGKRLIISLGKFTAGDKNTEEATHKVANETGIVRIIGSGNESEIEIIHDRLALQIFESKNERIAKEIHEEATRKEREAESLKQSAQKAKKATLRISVVAGIIIALLTAFAIRIYINFKNDHTLIGLNEQLLFERKANQRAQDSILTLNNIIQNTRLGLDTIHSKAPINNEQAFKAQDKLIREQRISIDSLLREKDLLAASVTEKDQRLQSLQSQLRVANDNIRILEASTLVPSPASTVSTEAVRPFKREDFSDLEILNKRSPNGYDFTDIKQKGFMFNFKVASVSKTEKGWIEVRVFTNVTRANGSSENVFETVQTLQTRPEPKIVVKAPRGLRPGKASYEVTYFIDRKDIIDRKEKPLILERGEFTIIETPVEVNN